MYDNTWVRVAGNEGEEAKLCCENDTNSRNDDEYVEIVEGANAECNRLEAVSRRAGTPGADPSDTGPTRARHVKRPEKTIEKVCQRQHLFFQGYV